MKRTQTFGVSIFKQGLMYVLVADNELLYEKSRGVTAGLFSQRGDVVHLSNRRSRAEDEVCAGGRCSILGVHCTRALRSLVQASNFQQPMRFHARRYHCVKKPNLQP